MLIIEVGFIGAKFTEREDKENDLSLEYYFPLGNQFARTSVFERFFKNPINLIISQNIPASTKTKM